MKFFYVMNDERQDESSSDFDHKMEMWCKKGLWVMTLLTTNFGKSSIVRMWSKIINPVS